MPLSRSSLLRINVFTSFIIKGWSALIVFFMVPLTLKMLGPYDNGVWLTISSILVWIDLLDIGLGNGMRNALACYIAQDNIEKAREVVSSTLFMLICVVGLAFIIIFPIMLYGDMNSALGIDFKKVPELNTLMAIAFIFVCLSMILKFIGNFYLGLQLPAINNLIICLGQTLALAGTYTAYLFGCHSLTIVVFINVAFPFVVWLCSYPITFIVKYKQFSPAIRYVKFRVAKNLCNLGIQFFTLQVCSLILFASTNIIISKFISPTEVTTYQVSYRYFSIIMVLFTIICMPFWNATTDAYTKNDITWIKKASRKMNIMMIGIAVLIVVMVLISQFIYNLWVGNEVKIPLSLSIAMAFYQFVLVVSMRYSYFLNGINILRIQLIFTCGATLIFMPLAWYICTITHSVTALVTVMCFVNIPGLFANMWKFKKILKKAGQF